MDKPESGKIYALTGGTGTPCVMNGNTWAESVVVLVRDGEVLYEATVTDVKTTYGSTLYHVVPVAGCGHKWVKDFVHKGYGGSYNGAKEF